MEILDQFGRSKTICKNSEEYQIYLENEKLQNLMANDSKIMALEPENEGKWAWSKGIDNEECGGWKKDITDEKDLKTLVSRNVEKEIEYSLSAEYSAASNDSKVKTMWQKTLENSSKIFLKEIHEDSEINRNNFAEKIQSNRLEDRRELLRLKRLQYKNNKP